MRQWAIAGILLILSACGSNSTTPVAGADAIKTYPAHTRPLRLVKGDLPPGTEFEVLGKVKAIEGTGGMGDSSAAERKLAQEARQIGADAVIQVRTWFAPRAFSWAAPHAEGVAVKLRQPAGVELEKLPGSTY